MLSHIFFIPEHPQRRCSHPPWGCRLLPYFIHIKNKIITAASAIPVMINVSAIFASWALLAVLLATPAVVLVFVLVGVWPDTVVDGLLPETEVVGAEGASKSEKAAKAGGLVTIGAKPAVTVRVCVTNTLKYPNASSSQLSSKTGPYPPVSPTSWTELLAELHVIKRPGLAVWVTGIVVPSSTQVEVVGVATGT
jgi:hypothetical protein